MTDTKATALTRTHIAFFEQYVEDLFRRALTETSAPDTNVDSILALIDFRDYGKRFGEAVLSQVSYQDLKYAEKVLSDERITKATAAINHAVAHIKVSKDDSINHEVDARFILNTATTELELLDALAGASQEVQDKAIEILQARDVE
ncbi:hypothetical protein [Pseudomonas sp. GV047]|uniref:hypothetical protein n=1 Tax=Pseudomonas sp. GV047 TaxID=2135751 RepID=UPI000D3B000F|nr:hypothetical protein [Pseudomonas sp. GV047]PUB40060.1 hypothetical protein C8K58_11446 [Pseudomonas sp. GV047]